MSRVPESVVGGQAYYCFGDRFCASIKMGWAGKSNTYRAPDLCAQLLGYSCLPGWGMQVGSLAFPCKHVLSVCMFMYKCQHC